MELAFNKRTALALMRTLRAANPHGQVFTHRTNLRKPDIHPMKLWSRSTPECIETEMSLPCRLNQEQIDLAVPARETRIRAQGVACTVYTSSIPADSFIDIGHGALISSPELLFVELAASMHPIEHLMLGHELCGTFCRNAASPYNKSVIYGAPPLTSVARIAKFLEDSRSIIGIGKARKTLSFLNDNAWSPTESLIAAYLRLPIDDLGYELGELSLNPRVPFESRLPGAKSSRVPDIMITGTPVGINYDGLVHLDLSPVIRAAVELGAHPEAAYTQAELNKAAARVRNKALDDIRRNRELAVDGLTVLPVTKEDLYTQNGLNQLVSQLLDFLERFDGRDVKRQRKSLRQRLLNEDRYRLMLSFLPGNHERDVQVGHYVGGYKAYDGPSEIHECWIEL